MLLNLIQSGKRERPPFKGQATIELALLISFLLLLLVGVADVARIYGGHLAVVHAAGVGARWTTLSPNQRDCSGYADVQAAVLDDLGGAVKDPTVVVLPTPAADPRHVRVEITYSHDFLFGMINNLPNSFTGGATMPGNIEPGSGTCNATPVIQPTSTSLPTATRTPLPPTPTRTPLPTNTPTSTPTNTPTATSTPVRRLVISNIIGRVPGSGNNERMDISVMVHDDLGAPITGAVVPVVVTQPGSTGYSGAPPSDVGGSPGLYRLCNVGRVDGGSTQTITITVNATMPGYQAANTVACSTCTTTGSIPGCR